MDLGVLMGRFHQTYDVLLTPTLPLPAFPAGQDVPDGWPLAGLDELDAVHLSVQPDPAARAERAVRVHLRRAADRPADRRPAARRRAGAAGRPGVRVRHRLAPSTPALASRGGPMSRYIAVALDKRGVSCIARLLDNEAPRTARPSGMRCRCRRRRSTASTPATRSTHWCRLRRRATRVRRTPRSRRFPATCAGSRSTARTRPGVRVRDYSGDAGPTTGA